MGFVSLLVSFFHPSRGSGSFLFIIFLSATALEVVVGTVGAEITCAGAVAAACACKTPLSATQKVVRFATVVFSLPRAASSRRSLQARMSRMLLFSGAFIAVPSASTSSYHRNVKYNP
jgi:hypothetical protein